MLAAAKGSPSVSGDFSAEVATSQCCQEVPKRTMGRKTSVAESGDCWDSLAKPHVYGYSIACVGDGLLMGQ